MDNNEFIKMTFPNKLDYSFIVQRFAREIARMIGFSGRELDQIDIAVEESVSNIMVHASDEDNPTFDIICEKIPGGIKIILKEMGIPFDPEKAKKYKLTKNLDEISTSGLGIFLIQKMMDQLSFNNLGPGGKETVMVKYLPGGYADRPLDEINAVKTEACVITEKIEYDVRGMQEDEAIEVSRCAYKTHGYTFFDDDIYYPDRLIAMNRTLRMISVVAVTRENVFMGHCALLFQHPEDIIGEMTFAFVKVEFRGQGALNRLTDYLLEMPKKRECSGVYAYAVTNHTFTQKPLIKFRVNVCGLLLATSPASWKFKGFADESNQRISVVLGFRYIMPPVRYDLFAPGEHKEMIYRLYSNLGATHNFVIPQPGSFQFSTHDSIIFKGVNELESCGEIFIASYGADIIKVIRRVQRDFCLKNIAAINLFLNLKDPLTYWLTKEFEVLGFFFAGILPESRIGDALILQYLNNVELDYDKIQLITDMSKELLVYIKKNDPNIID